MLDIFAGCCAVIGMWLVGNKNIWCFAFFMAANILWVGYAFQSRTWGLLIECPVGMALCIRSWRKWHGQKS
jgi:hypothetical protein